jgi:hypothetical protein
MKKIFQVMGVLIILGLAIMLFIQVKENREYKSYLKQENKNSISSILSNIQRMDDVLKRHEESGEITYGQLSSIGMNYLNAESSLGKLYRQERFFDEEKYYSHKAYSVVLEYFDGVSMFISMDVLHTTGNHYPHANNEEIYFLNHEEQIMMEHIQELNYRFIEIIKAKGFLDNTKDSMEYYVEVETKNNGLETLDDLIESIAEEIEYFLGNQSISTEGSLAEAFLERVR